MKLKELVKVYKYDSESETFTLDIQLGSYHNVYNDWDFSPFINRDLDEDLTDYLLECSYDIPSRYTMIINFHIIEQDENKSREDRSKIGIHNYFKYQLRKIKNQKMYMLRNIINYTLIGSLLLLLSLYLKSRESNQLIFTVFSEGLFIGGWVMFWEMFSTFFFQLKTIDHKKRHFVRLNKSKIFYLYKNNL